MTTTLKYGDGSVTLEKSNELVGVRPGRRARGRLNATANRFGAVPMQTALGGFELLDVRSAGKPMEETLNTLRKDEVVEVGTHVYHTSNDGVPFVPTGQIYVEFADGSTLEERQKLLAAQSLEIVDARSDREIVVRVTPQSSNPVKVAAALQKSKVVAVAEPDLASPAAHAAFSVPSDSLLASQWHLQNPGVIGSSSLGLKQGADARVIGAWNAAQSLGSRSVVVAVIDDGFDLTHPDFAGTGKIVAPWDFTRNTADPTPEFSSGYPYYDPNDKVWVGDWHGTACAGVAVGAANGSGIVGAAPDCRLMPVRWGQGLSDGEIEAWFGYVAAQGAAVVSCSWGASAANFPLSTRMRKAITLCARDGRNGLGCVICFAAGNENHDINDPAHGTRNGFAIHPDVIAVAACTSMDDRSSYSNFGAEIAVCAPSNGAGGRGIMTTDVTGTFARGGHNIESGYSRGAFIDTFGGTSSATPLVAGIAGLVLTLKPELSASEVKQLLQRTARKIGPGDAYDGNGHSFGFGFGCINAEAAVAELLGASPNTTWTHEVTRDEPWFVHPAQGRPANGTISARTPCIVRDNAGSFSRIETATRVTGYVATGSLRAL